MDNLKHNLPTDSDDDNIYYKIQYTGSSYKISR